jgi:hypothetical protein
MLVVRAISAPTTVELDALIPTGSGRKQNVGFKDWLVNSCRSADDPCPRRNEGDPEALGEGHLVLTLRCIIDTRSNRTVLWSEVTGAVSDILAQRTDWQERPSELFEAFDAIDLPTMRNTALQRRPWLVEPRVMLYLALDLALIQSRQRGCLNENPSQDRDRRTVLVDPA